MSRGTALVTGATSGIGAAFARKLAGQGYDLVITGRRAEKISQLAEEIRAIRSVHVEVIMAELSDPQGVHSILNIVDGRKIHVLVNNAGFAHNALFYQGDLGTYERMIYVHITASIQLIHAVLPGMVEQGSGIIINVCSDAAFLPVRKNSVYTGTKSFLKGFSESWQLDLMNTGVKVQALCPGLTRTDFHEKMGMTKERQVNKGLIRWMSPEGVVDSAVKSLHKKKVVCIPGVYEKVLIRLLNALPGPLYNRIACSIGGK